MATTFTLDDIRAAAEKKYGATEIDLGTRVVSLVNALRLPKGRRDELLKLQDRLQEEGADQEELVKEAILLVAATEGEGKALLKAVGDDLAVLMEIFQNYAGETELGEASASDD